MQLTTIENLTMTSREIAELVEKEHKHVMRDIRKMLDDLNQSKVGLITYTDSRGREQTEYRLNKDLTMTLISGYNVKLRHKIMVRWRELEEKRVPQINFDDPAAAARAWADQYEARLLAEKTKAEIGSRREATAMATASVAVKKVSRLEIELDQSQQYCSIKRMQMIHHGQKFDWRLLKSTSAEMELPPKDVFDQNYGTVKAYHVDVWAEAYAVTID